MKRVIITVAVALSIVGAAETAAAQQQLAMRSSERSPSFMRVYGTAQPPYGFVRFCEQKPELCNPSQSQTERFDATPARLSELDEVNRSVNAAIKPETDLEIYGVSEHWTLPYDRGDCEDYALLKREMLLSRGWPSSALLMTVVRDEKGDGHAVLTVRTQQGDYVLDNKVADVRIWYRSPYEFVMRQSYLNPRAWVSLNSGSPTSPAAIAGVSAQR